MGAVGAIEAISAAQNQVSERSCKKKREEAKQEELEVIEGVTGSREDFKHEDWNSKNAYYYSSTRVPLCPCTFVPTRRRLELGGIEVSSGSRLRTDLSSLGICLAARLVGHFLLCSLIAFRHEAQ